MLEHAVIYRKRLIHERVLFFLAGAGLVSTVVRQQHLSRLLYTGQNRLEVPCGYLVVGHPRLFPRRGLVLQFDWVDSVSWVGWVGRCRWLRDFDGKACEVSALNYVV